MCRALNSVRVLECFFGQSFDFSNRIFFWNPGVDIDYRYKLKLRPLPTSRYPF
jgi:hypothetical protein